MNFNFLYKISFGLFLSFHTFVWAENNQPRLQDIKKNDKDLLSHSSDCDKIITYFESFYNIPKNLLRSIAMVESEKKPWAVNCAGKSRNFSNKNDAVIYVKKMRAKGFKNINIGCMQINYQSHSKNFKTIEDFLTPYNNIKYAAKYLSYLKNNLGSWQSAVKYYHSSIPYHQNIYLKKVTFHGDFSEDKKMLDILVGVENPKTDVNFSKKINKKPLLRVGFGPFASIKK